MEPFFHKVILAAEKFTGGRGTFTFQATEHFAAGLGLRGYQSSAPRFGFLQAILHRGPRFRQKLFRVVLDIQELLQRVWSARMDV